MSDGAERIVKVEQLAGMVRELPKNPKVGDTREVRALCEMPPFHVLGDVAEAMEILPTFAARAVEFWHPSEGRQVRWVIECEGVAV